MTAVAPETRTVDRQWTVLSYPGRRAHLPKVSVR